MWNKSDFSQRVEEIKAKDTTISYFDVIQDICSRNDIELVVVPDLLTEGLKRKIAKEAYGMRMVKAEAVVQEPNIIENALGLDTDESD